MPHENTDSLQKCHQGFALFRLCQGILEFTRGSPKCLSGQDKLKEKNTRVVTRLLLGIVSNLRLSEFNK